MKTINRITWRSTFFVGQREILFYRREIESVSLIYLYVSFQTTIKHKIKKRKRKQKASDPEVSSGGASP